MEKVVVSLGTNMGDRFYNMYIMEQRMARLLDKTYTSPLYETEALGAARGQRPYLNRVMAGYYSKTPRELLKATQVVEKEMGRTGKGEYAPRYADIDILLFGHRTVTGKDLTIPHHALWERRFILEGLKDVVPHWSVTGHPPFREIIVPRTLLTQGIVILDC
ncbi:MAG: 2-amino-4-hydroxy-6-hydroxymethyldihydropteridine diphosphokinase [Fibrobacterota bacterium]